MQINRVYIRATPQAIWDAITQPDWTEKYGYGGRADFDLRPGGAFKIIASAEMQQAGMPEVVVDGKVIEADPPGELLLIGEELATAVPVVVEAAGKRQQLDLRAAAPIARWKWAAIMRWIVLPLAGRSARSRL